MPSDSSISAARQAAIDQLKFYRDMTSYPGTFIGPRSREELDEVRTARDCSFAEATELIKKRNCREILSDAVDKSEISPPLYEVLLYILTRDEGPTYRPLE